MTATATPLSMWAALSAHGVPKEYRGAASLAMHDFLTGAAEAQDAAALEWRRQREAAFPHVPGEGPLAGRCLCCSDPFPCDGYIRDIDNGVIAQ